MKTIPRLLLVAAVALLLLSCDERTEQTDSGGVVLEITFGTVVPNVGFMTEIDAAGVFVAPTFTITSNLPNASGGQSTLMDVHLQGIEVLYERVDGGTRLPPPYYIELIGTVPAGGNLVYSNLPLMSTDQVTVPPLTDLLAENGGFDSETGKTSIAMTFIIRAYGRTVGERNVSSSPRRQTVEIFQ
jgi:hypothetical protein